MSTPSLTPVATGTTSVFGSAPVIRFHQAIDLDLAVSDLERQVRRLARQLTPVSRLPLHSGQRSIGPAWQSHAEPSVSARSSLAERPTPDGPPPVRPENPDMSRP